MLLSIKESEVTMFHVNDFVVHPTGGICRVEKIAPLEIPGADKNRDYYFLIPIREKGGKVFVPIDNDSTIRGVMTSDEAWELIDEIPSIEELSVETDKQRELRYKEAIKSLDCRELVKIIKNLTSRRTKRLMEGKKTTATDDKYIKIAEENLYSELAFAIGKERCEMESVISERIASMG